MVNSTRLSALDARIPLEGNRAGQSARARAYLYDGTLEGLLTAIFKSYENHELVDEVVREAAYQPRLGQDALLIETSEALALRVRRGIVSAAGRNTFSAIVRASTCDDYDTGTIVYRFVRFVMARPKRSASSPVLDDLTNPVVADLMRLARFAANECEKMRQFVRFSELENGIWFARCNPAASVVPLVMGHFAARFNDQPFVIYDENHALAGVHARGGWQLIGASGLDVCAPSAHDRDMQEAWKRFYDTLSIDARFNPELRRHFMPVRLWENLTELKPRR